MSKDQRDSALSWLRGDMPTWIAVGLLAALGWGGKEAYNHFTSTLAKTVDIQAEHSRRIAVLEDWRSSSRERNYQ